MARTPESAPARSSAGAFASGVVRRQRSINAEPCPQCEKKDRFVQRRLAVGASNDPLELEADCIADRVLAAPAHVDIGCAPVPIQRQSVHPSDATGGPAPPSVDRALAGAGRVLEPGLLRDMEQRFGHDFSQVRIQSDASAAQSAADINAKAYTAGHRIVFGAGRYAPQTREGRHLIAHELTHVLQQSSRASAAAPLQRNTAADEAAYAAERSDPRNHLPFTMSAWKARGLLDPPNLPKDVAPIPPLPISEKQAKQLKADFSTPAAMMGSVASLGSAAARNLPPSVGAPLPPPAFAEGTGAIEKVGADVAATGAESEAVAATGATVRSGVGGATLAGIGAGIAVILYESPSAPAWTDTMSEVTGEPYGGPGERSWDIGLTASQHRYLRDLWRQRLTPPPAPMREPEPKPVPFGPSTRAQPDTSKDKAPSPSTRVEPDGDQRRRRGCEHPTGLTPFDPIPITWFKPVHDSFYPRHIEVRRDGMHGVLDRDDPGARLPDGTPVGVRTQHWPRLDKILVLIPQRRAGMQRRYKQHLADWGLHWGKTLQPDHVQDLDWGGPDAYGNLWPYETSTNLSAGSTQNVNQEVSFCLTPKGPAYVKRRISTVKKLLYGRYFAIKKFLMHS